MALFEPIYRKLMSWAAHRHAERYLAGLSFAESSFFPIPVDVMLAPMVLAENQKAWRLALITTVMSVLGGCFGYFIGAFFFDVYGAQIIDYFHAQETFDAVKSSYIEFGMIIVLLAGFTPIPYKIFTIASGVIGIAFLPFFFMSLLSRGARFFLVAGLVKLGGDKLKYNIHRTVEWLGWGTVVITVVAVAIYKYG